MLANWLLLVVLTLKFNVSARILTTNDVNTISTDIVNTFNITPQYGIICNDKVTPCPLGNLFGGILRLAFHDAAGNGKVI